MLLQSSIIAVFVGTLFFANAIDGVSKGCHLGSRYSQTISVGIVLKHMPFEISTE